MSNRLKDMGEMAAWRLMVKAAVTGANKIGYEMKRQPGRGLSNVWEASKNGKVEIVPIRTTRDRCIAFPPLDNGAHWKTLDGADQVIVSAVDNPENPQNIEVYLFPANVVKERFDASYAARIKNGHTVRDNFGMWVKLDAAETDLPTQVGGGLAVDYPAIARFSIDELENGIGVTCDQAAQETPDDFEGATFSTVSEVISWARSEIARLSGMPIESIKMDLKFEA